MKFFNWVTNFGFSLLLVSLFPLFGNSQDSPSKFNYYEGELMAGSIVPNNMHYPPFGVMSGAAFTIGRIDTTTNSLSQYFNYPKNGIYMSFHHLGNDTVFGQQISLMPVIELKANENWSFRIGLGISYYSKMYRDNNENEAVGSHFTWGFQTYLYRYISINEQNYLKIGGAFLHGSNGHTQLPNYGLNSAAISIGWQYFTKPLSVPKRNRHAYKGTKTWMLSQRVGVGLHEFGGTQGPVGGKKRLVYNGSIAVGVLLKKHFKLQAGIGYRYYEQYAKYIQENPQLGFTNAYASNVYFTLGSELFLRHVSMVMEGGINLYKPFYPHFVEEYEDKTNWSYELKKLFLSRVGLNFYLLDTSKFPKHNVYLGAQLHANFGQADFSGVSLGYVVNLDR